MLRNYISNRTSGLLFCRPNGLQVLQRTVLKMSLQRILDNPELEKGGFNIFRRFRITHLKTSECPDFLHCMMAEMALEQKIGSLLRMHEKRFGRWVVFPKRFSTTV